MKKLNKVAVLFATVAVAGAAVAAPSAAGNDNWQNGQGGLQWKNGTNELCWRDNYWTPASAAAGCDGAIVAQQPVKTAPASVVTPVTPQRVAPTAEKVTYAADAFFAFDKAILKPEGKATLDELASRIQALNLEAVVATGHTDSVGADAYNQRLGMRRAQAVKAYLVSKGISADRVYAESKGEQQPAASNKTADGRAKNRRVEIEVVGTR